VRVLAVAGETGALVEKAGLAGYNQRSLRVCVE